MKKISKVLSVAGLSLAMFEEEQLQAQLRITQLILL